MIRLLILLLFYTPIIKAEIIQTPDYFVIKHKVSTMDRDSLIIFDLDDVLTMPTRDYNLSLPIRKKLAQNIEDKYGEEFAKNFWSIILQNRKIKYVDEMIPSILSYIKDKQIPTIALTKCFTHQYGRMQNAHDWRISELKSLKIDFTDLSPIKGELKLVNIPKINGRPSSTPMHKNGIIFTARADKGMILEQILTHYNYHPKKILLIDDKFRNIISLERFAKKYNISFDGIIITKVNHLEKEKLDYKEELERFKILENQEKWKIK